MLIAFFNAEGVIHQEFVPAGQRVNAEFYVGVLDRLLKRIRRVRTAKFQSSEWFLLHDNSPSHNAAVVSKTAFLEGMKKLKERANKCIDQGGMYFEE